MVSNVAVKIKGMERDFILLLLVGVFVGIGQSVDGSTLNNFLKEKFDILIMQRTLLEIPRELPGLLVFLVIGVFHAFGDIRIAALSRVCLCCRSSPGILGGDCSRNALCFRSELKLRKYGQGNLFAENCRE